MIDILLVVEWTWCALLVSARGARLALLISGGALASTYVASQLSGWLTHTFAPPDSPVLRYVQAHVSTRPDTVAALSAFAPAQAVAATGEPLSQLIAYQLLHVLLYLAMTMAVFILFLMVWHFSNAVWDHASSDNPGRRLPSTWLLSVTCSTYLVVLTALFLGNLAWLQGTPFLADAAAHSVGMNWIGHFVRHLHVLH